MVVLLKNLSVVMDCVVDLVIQVELNRHEDGVNRGVIRVVEVVVLVVILQKSVELLLIHSEGKVLYLHYLFLKGLQILIYVWVDVALHEVTVHFLYTLKLHAFRNPQLLHNVTHKLPRLVIHRSVSDRIACQF